MANNFNLFSLYKSTFGNAPYFVKDTNSNSEVITYDIPRADRQRTTIDYTTKQIALNKKSMLGKDIWFPVTFWLNDAENIEIEACTIGVQLSKTIVKTAVSERKGTVKEQFNIDDYRFTIKGFLIGKNRLFPEDQINMLKNIFETNDPVYLKGGYPELFLEENAQVVLTSLDFPEVEGKSPFIRPFSLMCESDYIEDLILDR
ncbi:DUF6046 domain-containing protein [Flavobacterium sp.]